MLIVGTGSFNARWVERDYRDAGSYRLRPKSAWGIAPCTWRGSPQARPVPDLYHLPRRIGAGDIRSLKTEKKEYCNLLVPPFRKAYGCKALLQGMIGKALFLPSKS